MYDPDLPSNRLVYEARRKAELFRDFPKKLEQLMSEYGLSEVEKSLWREADLLKLGELGVHPYFLPQISRLLNGSQKNDSQSQAAQAFRNSIVDRS